MKCIKCRGKAGISLRHIGSVCRTCFLEIIEKRVRKEFRTKKLIKKNDRILMIDNGSKEFAVGEYLLNNIIKNLPAKIEIKKSSKSTKKYDKIIIPWSLDDECEEFLNMVFNKKKQPKFSKKAIKLLMNVSDEEIGLFAKIKGFKHKKRKKSKIKQMLDLLEKRYPGYKFSLLNSTKALSSENK
jgi:tRNA(Ile)-lysidine synthase TilS/MesJ